MSLVTFSISHSLNIYTYIDLHSYMNQLRKPIAYSTTGVGMCQPTSIYVLDWLAKLSVCKQFG